MDRGALDGPARSRPFARLRPSRVFRERLARVSDPSAAAVWAWAAWLGLACGLVEGLVRLAWRLSGLHVGDPDLWVNWNTPWMVPLAQSALFFGLGVLLSLLRLALPRTAATAAPVALTGIGAWSALSTLPGLNPWALKLLAAALAFRVGRRLRLDNEPARRLARASLPALAAVWVTLFVTTGVWPRLAEPWALAVGPKPPAHAPNVLLVVLDTVRADSLSLHGYGRPTSPKLSELSRLGVRFDQARATTPYTLGTHASLFTGHWMSETSARVGTPLDGSRPTLAEHLRDRGYATGGFVGNIFYGSAHYGLDRGFSHYHDSPGNVTRAVTPRELFRSSRLGDWLLTWAERKLHVFAPMQRLRLDGDEVNIEALAWVDRTRQTGRPFFLFVNHFDAHSDYSLPSRAPQPHARLTADRLEARMKELERAEARNDTHPGRDDAALQALRAEVNALLRDSYDDGISWVDRKLDELLRGLKTRGLLDDTLVIVTADHGEMLGEHGVIGHGTSLHRQVVHVPLVVIGARGMGVPAGAVVQRPVTLRDVPSTVLDLLNDPGASAFPGRPLQRFWAAGADPAQEDEPVLSEMEHLGWRAHTSRTPAAFGPLWLLTEGRYSYHRQDRPGEGTIEHLYDLTDDPGETRDLAADPRHRETLESLRKRFRHARPNPTDG
ncbi:MAG: sulfatase-like hydrolase/transferase [Isosphaeraceae bacterium]